MFLQLIRRYLPRQAKYCTRLTLLQYFSRLGLILSVINHKRHHLFYKLVTLGHDQLVVHAQLCPGLKIVQDYRILNRLYVLKELSVILHSIKIWSGKNWTLECKITDSSFELNDLLWIVAKWRGCFRFEYLWMFSSMNIKIGPILELLELLKNSLL